MPAPLRTREAYWSVVRSLAREAVDEGYDDTRTWVEESCDGGAWTTYPRHAVVVLTFTEAAEAAEEAYHRCTAGSLGGMMSACAWAAMVEDVLAECQRVRFRRSADETNEHMLARLLAEVVECAEHAGGSASARVLTDEAGFISGVVEATGPWGESVEAFYCLDLTSNPPSLLPLG